MAAMALLVHENIMDMVQPLKDKVVHTVEAEVDSMVTLLHLGVVLMLLTMVLVVVAMAAEII